MSKLWISRGNTLLAGSAVATVLVGALPLFLCMPVWCDSSFFDICARVELRGDILYKEVFQCGPPGAMLMRAAVRAVIGWGTERLRFADFLFVTASVWLLAWSVLPLRTVAARLWTVFVLYLFYFATTEWSHCQPDVWMLLPTVGALVLRQRQTIALLENKQRTMPRFLSRGFLEGVLWGLAVCIKPFVVLIAVPCILVAMVVAWRTRQPLQAALMDAAAVFLGGLFVGVITVGWLWGSGNWPYFIAGFTSGYNQDYYRNSPSWTARVFNILTPQFWPWCMVHLVAIPLAAVSLCLGFARLGPARRPSAGSVRLALLAGCYLGWFVQANFVQWQFDYHVAPTVLLALALVAGQQWLFAWWGVRIALVPGLVVCALVVHPALRADRRALWGQCCQKGSTPEIRDRLGLDHQVIAPSWVDLARVAEFLRSQGIRDGELTIASLSAIDLYNQLDVKPSTRHPMLPVEFEFYPNRRDELLRELYQSRQKYVVSDLVLFGLDRRHPYGEVRISGNLAKVFPWNQPIIFRAGRYVVHRVVRGDGSDPAATVASPGERHVLAVWGTGSATQSDAVFRDRALRISDCVFHEAPKWEGAQRLSKGADFPAKEGRHWCQFEWRRQSDWWYCNFGSSLLCSWTCHRCYSVPSSGCVQRFPRPKRRAVAGAVPRCCDGPTPVTLSELS
jgi:hypothetical protein